MSDTSKSQRSLHDMVIGVSVSESENLSEWGYVPADVNRATVRLSEALLAAGARLMFGHDWRPDGIMDAICRLALKFQPADSEGPSKPLIHNLLPWPIQPTMDPSLRTELEQRGVLKIEMLPAPKGEWQSPTDDTAKALALTELRQRLANDCDARVCLGGKEAKLKDSTIGGFYAGVIEEAYHTAMKGKPVYFANFLGGACASLVTCLKGQETEQQAVQHVLRIVPSKQAQFQMVMTRALASAPSATSVPEVMQAIREDLSDGFVDGELQERSGLNADEWDTLLHAPDTEAFVTLVIRGLREVARRKTAGKPQPDANAEPKPGRTRTRKPRPPKS